MDLGSAIIGIVFLAACIVPFVIIHINRSSKERKMLELLSDFAKQHQCNLSQHELCGDYVIGIDEAQNFVFFHKKNKVKESTQYIDLADIQSCKTVSTSRTFNGNEGNTKVIERLILVFTSHDTTKGNIEFDFYNNEVSAQLYGELQSIEKWEKIIKSQLKAKK